MMMSERCETRSCRRCTAVSWGHGNMQNVMLAPREAMTGHRVVFLVTLCLVALCTVAIYVSMTRHFIMSGSEYADAPYNEELVHASGAKAFVILAMSLLPLLFGGVAIWLTRHGVVAVFHPRLQAVKGWQWAAAIATVVLVYFSIINRGLPRVEDDLAYLFQARLFSHGMKSLSMDRFDSIRRSLFWWWTTGDANLHSFQIPGHSLLLSLGALLGHFSVISVCEAALTCLATYKAAALLYGKRVAALAGLLFVTSPFAIGTFSSYCASCSVALAVSVTLWAWAKFRRDPGIRWAIALGGGLGLTVWMRPSSSLFVGLPILIDGIMGVREKNFKASHLACSLLCVFLFCAGYIGYCSSLAGHFSLSPGDVYSQRMLSNEVSVANLSRYPPDQSVPMPGVLYSLASLNIYLHGWPISLLFVILFLAIHRKTRVDWILLTSCLLMFCFYAVKARILGWYYFELFPALVLLSSRSIDGLYEQCLAKWGEQHTVSRLLAAAVGAGVLTSVCFSIPLTLTKQHIYSAYYNKVPTAVEQTVKGHRALVLLGRTITSPLDKHLLSRNDPFLEDDIVYMSLDHATADFPALPSFLTDRKTYTLEIREPSRVVVVEGYPPCPEMEPRSHD